MDHNRRNHNLRLFARMGGPFDRLFFELGIFGDDLDPDEVTKILGVAPALCYRKDDERPKGSQYYKTGGWVLKSGEIKLEQSDSGDSKFENWAKSLPGDKTIWSDLQRRFTVSVRLVGYTDQWNADFKITSAALAELASRGLSLNVEPFLSLDEPDA